MDGIKSIKTFKFLTSDGHTLHVEESGNKSGIPTLFLHGGPGAGIGQNYLWPFVSDDHRLIAFDQRGCGLSQPFGELENNTTSKLIEDIEALRMFFNVDKWLIFGGSWGSTLGLAYAIAYPQRVSGLILRGIFLGREEDANWFTSSTQGASQVFPLEYKAFTQEYENTRSQQQSLCQWYFGQLTHTNESLRHQAAGRWFNWEGSISKLKKIQMPDGDYASNQQVYSLALLECFYLLNNCFMPPNYILDQAHKISEVPLHIVHGRYDMVCKCESAVKLHQALPHSILSIVEDAGHSMTEKGTSEALVKALSQMKALLKQN
ncbi:MAG: proline iminopeptidase [Kangiellaceae bacterium]